MRALLKSLQQILQKHYEKLRQIDCNGDYMNNRREWSICRDELVSAIVSLGFPGEFGDQIAKQLGSPKAMQRMTGYLNNVKPHSAELIADEMISICTEIDRWKEKKACEEANANYNRMLWKGLFDSDSDE